MTPYEFTERMRAIVRPDDGGPADLEIAHEIADQLMGEALKALGYEEGWAIFDDMPKWYA